MTAKCGLIVFALFCGLAAADANKKYTERQSFPEQFSQFTNKFQETFVHPSGQGGGGGSNPFSQFGQFPTDFNIPQFPSKRQLDPSQFSQFANKFQETFKPPSGMPSFPSLPSSGGNPIFQQPGKRQIDSSQFSQLTNKLQETFKPPSGGNQFGFGNFPNPTGQNPFA